MAQQAMHQGRNLIADDLGRSHQRTMRIVPTREQQHPMLYQHAQQFGIQLTQDAHGVGGLPLINGAQLFPELPEQFNGTITNDKFCMSRMEHIHLSWWRLPLQARLPVTDSMRYPSDVNEMNSCHQEGTHEETSVDGPTSPHQHGC